MSALLDGRPVDWDRELARSPDLAGRLEAVRMLSAIAQIHRAGDAVEDSTGATESGLLSSASPTRLVSPAPFPRWGPLEVREKIGEGASGVVYRAFDPNLRKEVALKIWNRGGESAEQFFAEAQRLALVRHPNVLIVHGAAEHDGRVGMWTDFLRGENLEGVLKDRGPLKAKEATEIGIHLCSALTALHSAGLVHRDLKTSNVMREPDGRIVLMDFGAAIEAEEATGRFHGQVAGTPLAMAPEQLRGHPPTPVSDIYGLGVLLYRLLTKGHPLEARSIAELVRLQERGRIRPLRERRRHLPRALVQVIERALAFDRERRFSTAAEMKRALAACLARGPGRRALGSTTAWEGVHAAIDLPAVPHNLPLPESSFIGRPGETRHCAALLRKSRVVTLTGPGGVGKTRLALELAASRLAQFPDGVWFVDLSALADSARVADVVALTLGVRLRASRSVLEAIADHLANRRILILLDNCEHLIEGCREVTERLLSTCPQVTWLVTSRESLGIEAESAYPVPPLALPTAAQSSDPAAARSAEAVRLFTDRARAVQPGFAVTDQNVRAVTDVCRKLDGLPFAIELAATHVRMLSPLEIARMLKDRFRILRARGPAPPRLITLQATIEWSYELLKPEERALFRSLALFPAGWTLESATAVCRADRDELALLELLTRLVNQSLVNVETRESPVSRYRMLETVRWFASGRLDRSGRRSQLEERWIDYFVGLLERAEPDLWGERAEDWHHRLESEHENLLAVLDACERAPERVVRGLRLARVLSRVWSERGIAELGRRQLARLLEQPTPDDARVHRARALTSAGDMAAIQDDIPAARAQFSEALELSESIHDPECTAGALSGLAHVALNQGDLATARDLFQRSLAIRRTTNDGRKIAVAINNLGAVLWRQGDIAAAREMTAEALASARALGDRYALPLALTNCELLPVLPGGPPSSPERLAECLRLIRELNARRNAPAALEITASVAAMRGDATTAARLYGAAEALRRSLGVAADHAWRGAHAPHLSAARTALGDGFADAWSRGLSLPFEAAIDAALASVEAPAPSAPRPRRPASADS